MEPNYDFDKQRGLDAVLEKHDLIGKAISYWIDEKGSLSLDTPEEEIIKFYKDNHEEEDEE